MPYNYFDSSEGRLAERVDDAWADYQDETLQEFERKQASKFLIHVFDIKKLSTDKDSLNKILVMLMDRREAKKAENPDYIPILHSASYHFDDTARILTPTIEPKVSPDSTIQASFNRGELLDVIAEERNNDLMAQPTFLSSYEREKYNITIFNGLFYKNGKIFDSSSSIAHNKVGYVAFTLNTNGEISVFNHLSGEVDRFGKKLVHSSMNGGAPVCVAGEMEIKKGQLISINNSSGHYLPSLYSITRFLEYLSDRDIDLSKTRVLLLHAPLAESCLKATSVSVAGSLKLWQSIMASDVIKGVNGVIESNIATINVYLESRKTKRKQNFFKDATTIAKVNLLNDLVTDLNYIKQTFKGTASRFVLLEVLDAIDSLISRYVDMYRAMRPRGRGRLGLIFDEIRQKTHEAVSEVGQIEPEQEHERLESFKRLPLRML